MGKGSGGGREDGGGCLEGMASIPARESILSRQLNFNRHRYDRSTDARPRKLDTLLFVDLPNAERGD